MARSPQSPDLNIREQLRKPKPTEELWKVDWNNQFVPTKYYYMLSADLCLL